MATQVPLAREMPEEDFMAHMKSFHRTVPDGSRAVHAGQHHFDDNGSRLGHLHVATTIVKPVEIVMVPDAHEMSGWKFLRHVRLRHTWLRDATFEAHTIDHYGRSYRTHDHTHASGDWNTADKHDALQEAVNSRPPVLPPARKMAPDDFVRHARDQHQQSFDSFAEHDRLHAAFPDQFGHRHKESA